eukprot:scaffold286728_cov30-Tisochrysis_lutea.AAC.1
MKKTDIERTVVRSNRCMPAKLRPILKTRTTRRSRSTRKTERNLASVASPLLMAEDCRQIDPIERHHEEFAQRHDECARAKAQEELDREDDDTCCLNIQQRLRCVCQPQARRMRADTLACAGPDLAIRINKDDLARSRGIRKQKLGMVRQQERLVVVAAAHRLRANNERNDGQGDDDHHRGRDKSGRRGGSRLLERYPYDEPDPVNAGQLFLRLNLRLLQMLVQLEPTFLVGEEHRSIGRRGRRSILPPPDGDYGRGHRAALLSPRLPL